MGIMSALWPLYIDRTLHRLFIEYFIR